MIDIKEHHRDLMQQILGTPDLPREVLDLYTLVKLGVDRISGGDMNPQILTFIAVVGAQRAGYDMLDPTGLNEEEDEDLEDTLNSVDWPTVPKGAQVVCNWHGEKPGTFLNVAGQGKLRIQIDNGPIRVIRARRVKLCEALTPG